MSGYKGMKGSMNAFLPGMEHEARSVELSQWYTPCDVAKRMWDWAQVGRGSDREWAVLEPSAGDGALLKPIPSGWHVTAVEIDHRRMSALEELAARKQWQSFTLHGTNFLHLGVEELGRFNLVFMNCPYEDGQDVAFILHALKFARRVVGIFTDSILFGVERKEGLWSQVRPTRIAFQSRRPFKGAQTDYVVLELVPLRYPELHASGPHPCTMEWW